MIKIMLQLKTLGWQKEDETSPNNILLKCHHGVEGFSWYLALRSLYIWEKSILCNDASGCLGEVLIFVTSMDSLTAMTDLPFHDVF